LAFGIEIEGRCDYYIALHFTPLALALYESTTAPVDTADVAPQLRRHGTPKLRHDPRRPSPHETR